jgi:hypothetical protein
MTRTVTPYGHPLGATHREPSPHHIAAERETLAAMSALIEAEPEIERAQSAKIRAGRETDSVRDLLTAAHVKLGHDRRYEARSPVPFPPGRGPVHEATKAVARMEALLAVAEQAETLAIKLYWRAVASERIGELAA